MSEAEELAQRCDEHADQCHDAGALGWRDTLNEAAALIRRLEKEREEAVLVREYAHRVTAAAARNKALDEAAQAAANALRFKSCACHNPVQEAILALKSKEPKP